MELWETLLISLLIAVILPVIFSAFSFFKTREEKKFTQTESVKTRPTKALSAFFLGFGILVLCGGVAGIIYCSITDSENTSFAVVAVTSVCVALFSGLGFFGYAYVRFNYVIADSDGVHVYRLFRKKKFFRYEEIAFFNDTTDMGMMGGLEGFGKDGRKIFSVEAMHVGVPLVIKLLREHGVTEKLKNITLSKL